MRLGSTECFFDLGELALDGPIFMQARAETANGNANGIMVKTA
jgi:hypothetical protein